MIPSPLFYLSPLLYHYLTFFEIVVKQSIFLKNGEVNLNYYYTIIFNLLAMLSNF